MTRVTHCGIAEHLEYGSDHWPIETIFDVTMAVTPETSNYA